MMMILCHTSATLLCCSCIFCTEHVMPLDVSPVCLLSCFRGSSFILTFNIIIKGQRLLFSYQWIFCELQMIIKPIQLYIYINIIFLLGGDSHKHLCLILETHFSVPRFSIIGTITTAIVLSSKSTYGSICEVLKGYQLKMNTGQGSLPCNTNLYHRMVQVSQVSI